MPACYENCGGMSARSGPLGTVMRETVRRLMDQILQIVGALLILAAYGLAQVGFLDQRSYLYLVLNLVGSFVLAVLALLDRQAGFLLLEGVWALISLASIVSRLRTRVGAVSEA